MATVIVLGVIAVALIAFVAYMLKVWMNTDRLIPFFFAAPAFVLVSMILNDITR